MTGAVIVIALLVTAGFLFWLDARYDSVPALLFGIGTLVFAFAAAANVLA